MKLTYTHIFFVTIALLNCKIIVAQDALQWDVNAQRLSDSTYSITLKGTAAKSWYVYAEDSKKEGLESPNLSFQNENVLKTNEIKNITKPVTIHDKIFDDKSLKVYRNEFEFGLDILVKGIVPSSIKITIHGFAANGKDFLPIEETKEIKLEGGVDISKNISNQIKIESVDLNKPLANCGDERKKESSILAIFLLGFGGGLIALLTPCVFPMIPVTVCFFTNRATTKKQGIRNGILYGIFILLIYLLASLPFHLIGNINPEIFNSISTNAWVNIFFFIVFIVFSFSFFGLFEITLPSSLATKTDSKSGLGSIGGIFFMALTLATVSFSCTGPILGSLLVSSLSSNGSAWQLSAGMSGFGIALALPLALFAMFPQWLKRLPKSGGWLDTMKKILAFAELALAFKFLSNADLVMHWGLLKREIFIAIWIIISTWLALYLFGIFEKENKISLLRKLFATVVLLFSFYLIPGLSQTRYANLKLLSGFPPPLSYSVYTNHAKAVEPIVINDYQKALALSREQHKPILIDFTGWACVNCRKMEEQVWTKQAISDLIKDKFILVSLYVDDRKKLSESFRYKTKDSTEKDINTVGDKWATFEAENFDQVTQPLYVIMNGEEKLMNLPVGYTPDVLQYKDWLECGLNASKK